MRLPVLPTLTVLIAIPILIGLGMWQLDRLAWKEKLLADLEQAPALQVIDLDQPDAVPAGFRRASITCAVVGDSVATGRTRNGRAGYSYRIPCASEESGNRVLLDLGWGPRPGLVQTVAIRSRYEGVLVAMDDVGAGFVLIPALPVISDLEASEPPTTATISNNHQAYAVQWFAFAAILGVIYLIYLRGWRTRRRVAAPTKSG